MKVWISTQEFWSISSTIAYIITSNSLNNFEQSFYSEIWYTVNERPEIEKKSIVYMHTSLIVFLFDKNDD